SWRCSPRAMTRTRSRWIWRSVPRPHGHTYRTSSPSSVSTRDSKRQPSLASIRSCGSSWPPIDEERTGAGHRRGRIHRVACLPAGVNVTGTLHVLLAAREHGAVVVSASSSSVYGDQREFPLRETFEPRPRSPYAVSKLAAEVWCSGLYRSFGVPAVSLRYFNV